jgi:hypothetical protein
MAEFRLFEPRIFELRNLSLDVEVRVDLDEIVDGGRLAGKMLRKLR